MSTTNQTAEASVSAAKAKAPEGHSEVQRARVGARGLRNILSLEDLEPAARRVLPKPIFGFYSGGTERDAGIRATREAFAALNFRPRVLTGAPARDLSTTIFGRTYSAPFGISPMGGVGFAWYRGDAALARAGAAADIPFLLSGAAMYPLEKIREEGRTAWFQAYIPGDHAIIGPLVERVARAGYDTLVITADVAAPGNRENNVRNGFSTPLRPSLRLAWQGITHPRWSINTFLKTLWLDGVPHLENAAATRGVPMFSAKAVRPPRGHGLGWDHVAWVREHWKGTLILKGVLAAADARRAREIGFDGVIVSNHGGRQLDGAAAPLRMLPEILAEAGNMTVMLDSGIRRGTDVIKALAMGAKFVFLGRPFMYAAALAGEEGAAHIISILRQELDTDMALLGCARIAEIDRELVC